MGSEMGKLPAAREVMGENVCFASRGSSVRIRSGPPLNTLQSSDLGPTFAGEPSPDDCPAQSSETRYSPLPVLSAEGENRGKIWASGRPILIDAADYAWASQYRWRLNDDGYVTRTEKGKTKRLHRDLLGAQPGDLVDHVNGEPTDNRRANLRFCSTAENLRNRGKTQKPTSSKYKGVWFARLAAHTPKPWRAQCRVKGKVTYLGSFATEEGAGLAYDLAAKREYGAFARLNFPSAPHSPHPTPAGGV